MPLPRLPARFPIVVRPERPRLCKSGLRLRRRRPRVGQGGSLFKARAASSSRRLYRY